MNVLSWLAQTAKGRDRNTRALAHVEVLLALASVHTILLRMVNVLYDLTAQPKLFAVLYNEIGSTSIAQPAWPSPSYEKLEKLDKVLRESQRMSPPSILGMKRLFARSHTFAVETYIPQGTYVCVPTYGIENDPEHTANPETFNGMRTYSLLQQLEQQSNSPTSDIVRLRDDPYQFLAAEPTVLNFGYGKHACPGRHFVNLILKIVFVKSLIEYGFRFPPQSPQRPSNLMAHAFLFVWPWQQTQVRRKENGHCPFQEDDPVSQRLKIRDQMSQSV